jgi:hypothetical protein
MKMKMNDYDYCENDYDYCENDYDYCENDQDYPWDLLKMNDQDYS